MRGVVSFLNVSIAENIKADSGYIFQQLIGREFIRRGYDFYLVSPYEPNVRGVNWIEYPLLKDKYEVRFNFPYGLFKRLFSAIDFDVIINTQIELGTNFRAVLTSCDYYDKLLLSYCHYQPLFEATSQRNIYDFSLNDNNLAEPLLLHQVAAAVSSDFIIFQSKYAKKLFLQGIDNVNYVDEYDNIIIYNHRLYLHYGTITIFKWLKEFYENIRKDFVVYILDPLLIWNIGRPISIDPEIDDIRNFIKKLPFTKFIKLSQERVEYYSWIKRGKLGLTPLRKGAVWSMAAVDCMASGLPVIAPDIASFQEFVPTQLRYKKRDDFFNILDILLDDEKFYSQCSQLCRSIAEQYSPKHIVDRFEEVISNLEV